MVIEKWDKNQERTNPIEKTGSLELEGEKRQKE